MRIPYDMNEILMQCVMTVCVYSHASQYNLDWPRFTHVWNFDFGVVSCRFGATMQMPAVEMDWWSILGSGRIHTGSKLAEIEETDRGTSSV